MFVVKKPLIKYTGGKFREYTILRDFFPSKIKNYYEPFFGGGGIFFGLHNDNLIDGKCFINDFSKSLMDLYESVKDDEFENELNIISQSWDNIREFGKIISKEFGGRFMRLLNEKTDENFVNNDIKAKLHNIESAISVSHNLHTFSLSSRIEKSLNDKMRRFQNKKDITDTDGLSSRCIETAICQAFYFIIRDMYNDWNNPKYRNSLCYTRNERSAQFVFIREYCFGSMFRFGSNGDFNIPYGGYGYNNKCFICKIDNIVDDEVKQLFRRVDIKCGDFEKAINEWHFDTNDFMFLDPPYDSTFSEYDNNSFTREDHLRLKETLDKCNCKWLMAIGKTDFIADLYKDYNIVEYDKTYMYQAKGDYDSKHTTHLAITNYDIDIN